MADYLYIRSPRNEQQDLRAGLKEKKGEPRYSVYTTSSEKKNNVDKNRLFPWIYKLDNIGKNIYIGKSKIISAKEKGCL